MANPTMEPIAFIRKQSDGPRPLDVGTSSEPGETWSKKSNGPGVSILHERTMVSSTSRSIAQTIAQARAIVLYTIALFLGGLSSQVSE